MSAVSDVLAMVAVFREFGVPVTFEPDWESRGNGLTADYLGGIVHHTASRFSDSSPVILRDGRPDLDGPLCQYAGLASGGIHVVAAHPANHAGASGGPGNGPFPVTTLFNRLVVGLEIVYPGTTAMTPAQYRTALVFAIAVRRVFGHSDFEWTRAHAETSREGKWDPGYAEGRTIDMQRFRRDAAVLEAEGDDMIDPQRDYPVLGPMVQRMLAYDLRPGGFGATHTLGPTIYERLARIDNTVTTMSASLAGMAKAVAALSNDPDLDATAVRDIVGQEVQASERRQTEALLADRREAEARQRDELVAAVRDARPDASAEEIVDELLGRFARAAEIGPVRAEGTP